MHAQVCDVKTERGLGKKGFRKREEEKVMGNTIKVLYTSMCKKLWKNRGERATTNKSKVRRLRRNPALAADPHRRTACSVPQHINVHSHRHTYPHTCLFLPNRMSVPRKGDLGNLNFTWPLLKMEVIFQIISYIVIGGSHLVPESICCLPKTSTMPTFQSQLFLPSVSRCTAPVTWVWVPLNLLPFCDHNSVGKAAGVALGSTQSY